MPLTGARQAAWDEVDAARYEMRKALDEILERIRESYIEINLHKTNAKAWKMLWGGGEDIASIVADVNRWSTPCRS